MRPWHEILAFAGMAGDAKAPPHDRRLAFLCARGARGDSARPVQGRVCRYGRPLAPLLALAIDPVRAAAITLPIPIAQDVVGVWAFRRTVDWRLLGWMLPGSMLGIALGYWFAASVSSRRGDGDGRGDLDPVRRLSAPGRPPCRAARPPRAGPIGSGRCSVSPRASPARSPMPASRPSSSGCCRGTCRATCWSAPPHSSSPRPTGSRCLPIGRSASSRRPTS